MIVPVNGALAQGDLADGRVKRLTAASFTDTCLTENGMRGKPSDSGMALKKLHKRAP
jgi:hypothetical protein